MTCLLTFQTDLSNSLGPMYKMQMIRSKQGMSRFLTGMSVQRQALTSSAPHTSPAIATEGVQNFLYLLLAEVQQFLVKNPEKKSIQYATESASQSFHYLPST